ncbi:hypothetical protein RJ640_030537 [Escallonia rubra]|uniref:AB hydrolase-1 domain-containing protein n=1 Tax=Escallonia rubra TaxID=112253 RepID=A0AA88U3U7_9ASTE|nr:hypothetical protein RJ640_030537 [Escallonia rubra]
MGAGTTNPKYFDFERYATLEGYAYDVLAILEELHVSLCMFVGHSLSSMVGALASIIRPDLFSKLVIVAASPRFLSTDEHFGGFEQEDIDQLCGAMESNYQAWCSRFTPLVVGGDMNSVPVQEFSRTLFSMRPGIEATNLDPTITPNPIIKHTIIPIIKQTTISIIKQSLSTIQKSLLYNTGKDHKKSSKSQHIALSVFRMIFQFNLRNLLSHVTLHLLSHIIQSSKGLAVPVVVSDYLHRNLGGKSVVEIIAVKGHLPQLSSPEVTVPVLLRHIRCYKINMICDTFGVVEWPWNLTHPVC